jgi:hypothetical protein
MSFLLISFASQFQSLVYGEKIQLFSPDSTPKGIPYKDLGKIWMNWAVSIPAAEGPNSPDPETEGLKISGPYQDCIMGESNNTVFLIANKGLNAGKPDSSAIERNTNCTIGSDKNILFPLIFEECDYGWVSGKTDEKLVECALERNPYAKIQFSIDGETLFDGYLPQNEYYMRTDYFDLFIPRDNLFGAPKESTGIQRALVDGAFIMTHPIPPGLHTIVITINQLKDPLECEKSCLNRVITYRLNVTDT